MIELGDMHVVGSPPPKLLKALAIISAKMHPLFALGGQFAYPEKSKESCVVASLTVRDFLRKVGFADAKAVPVFCVMRAFKGGKELHSVGVGKPDDADEYGRWSGHMVVTTSGFLIDTTLYPTIRPQWRGVMTGMMTVPLEGFDQPIFGREVIAGLNSVDPDDSSDVFQIMWLATPDNKRWRDGPDAKRKFLRAPVVAEMAKAFGTWK